MKRNTALKGIAWFAIMFVANGTPVGRVLDNSLEALFGSLTEKELFWYSFVVLTALCIYLSHILIALWGDKETTEEVPPLPEPLPKGTTAHYL